MKQKGTRNVPQRIGQQQLISSYSLLQDQKIAQAVNNAKHDEVL